MKIKSILCMMIIISLFLPSAIFAAETDENIQTLFNVFTWDYSNAKDLFSDLFLQQVSEKSLVEVIKSYKDKLGKLNQVTKTDGGYILQFEKGSAPAQISLDSNKKIVGLWFGNVTLNEDTLEKILSEFKKIPGSVSVSIIKNGKDVMLDYNGDKPMAVGSAFKLYVLESVYDLVGSGKISWKDIVLLNNKNKSVPSGILQDWNEGTPVTLKTLTNLMISISDNTATDHIIDYIGKDKIENLFLSERNKPFLKTSEVFKLKSANNPEIMESYIKADTNKRRELLKDVEKIDINAVSIPAKPVDIAVTYTHLSAQEPVLDIV